MRRRPVAIGFRRGFCNAARMKNSSKLMLAAAGLGIAAWRFRKRSRRYSFGGNVVVIAGGSRGLGFEMARRFLDEGAQVALLGRSEESLERAKILLLERTGREVYPFACDVTKRDEVERTFRNIVEIFGRIDVLVNNAGTILCAPFENHQDEDFEKSVATHLMGPVHTSRAVIPLMRRQGGGRILNVSSIGGKIGVPHMSAYSASKYALVGFSRSLAAELRRDGIRVTVACPGLMRTGSHRAARFAGREEEEFAWFSALSSAPGLSMRPEAAAKRLLEACRSGKVEVVFPFHWWAAAKGDQAMPGLSTKANDLVNRGLPEAVEGAAEARRGREVERGEQPARLEQSAVAHNQV